jgi:hypothetical protein
VAPSRVGGSTAFHVSNARYPSTTAYGIRGLLQILRRSTRLALWARIYRPAGFGAFGVGLGDAKSDVCVFRAMAIGVPGASR